MSATSTSMRPAWDSPTTCVGCATAGPSCSTSTLHLRTADGHGRAQSFPAASSLWIGPDLRLALLADVEAIAISEVWADATSPPAPAHVHRSHVESFYVLEGQLTFTIRERELRAEAGSWMQVPPGPPHALLLAVDRPVRYLDIRTPSCGFGAFLRG